MSNYSDQPAKVPPNDGFERESPQNAINSGFGIIVICLDRGPWKNKFGFSNMFAQKSHIFVSNYVGEVEGAFCAVLTRSTVFHGGSIHFTAFVCEISYVMSLVDCFPPQVSQPNPSGF